MRRSVIVVGIALTLLAISDQAQGAIGLSFVIDGDTYTQPFSITNISDGGEEVIRFQLDVSTATSEPLVFDTVTGGTPNTTVGVDFTPNSGTDITTGLVPLVGSPKVPDGASLLDISFTDFNPGETFSWDIDVDAADGSPVTVYGNTMIGSVATIDFSDGQRLIGVLSSVAGNSDASAFTVTGVTVTPSVPEPTTLAIWSALGGLGMIAARRRRKVA